MAALVLSPAAMLLAGCSAHSRTGPGGPDDRITVWTLENLPARMAAENEPAALDGCSRLPAIRKVVLPLATPSLMATALCIFMIAWNEFLFALLFLAATPENWTVSLGLQQPANGIEVS
ncbi:Binding-protein-dependent transport system inner membrane component [Streptomyces sp. WMMB 322]|nr:Binding-protein-dependent transport system inner membrane component [Streptomyces sp. WMMB 322]